MKKNNGQMRKGRKRKLWIDEILIGMMGWGVYRRKKDRNTQTTSK